MTTAVFRFSTTGILTVNGVVVNSEWWSTSPVGQPGLGQFFAVRATLLSSSAQPGSISGVFGQFLNLTQDREWQVSEEAATATTIRLEVKNLRNNNIEGTAVFNLTTSAGASAENWLPALQAHSGAQAPTVVYSDDNRVATVTANPSNGRTAFAAGSVRSTGRRWLEFQVTAGLTSAPADPFEGQAIQQEIPPTILSVGDSVGNPSQVIEGVVMESTTIFPGSGRHRQVVDDKSQLTNGNLIGLNFWFTGHSIQMDVDFDNGTSRVYINGVFQNEINVNPPGTAFSPLRPMFIVPGGGLFGVRINQRTGEFIHPPPFPSVPWGDPE